MVYFEYNVDVYGVQYVKSNKNTHFHQAYLKI
jgi:hypothetical protein